MFATAILCYVAEYAVRSRPQTSDACNSIIRHCQALSLMIPENIAFEGRREVSLLIWLFYISWQVLNVRFQQRMKSFMCKTRISPRNLRKSYHFQQNVQIPGYSVIFRILMIEK